MRVLKIGGRAQRDPRLPVIIADLWRAAPGALCVVHGGGDEISALQRALGREPAFVGGRRVTGAADIELLRMALSGAANQRLVARLVAAGVPAVGVSGEDAGLIGARRVDDAALGWVGVPTCVDARLLRCLLAGGWLPVISPLARHVGAEAGTGVTSWPESASGATDTSVAAAGARARDAAIADAHPDPPGALNVNGDDAAAAIAGALGATELLLVSDVPGVLAPSETAGTRAPLRTLDAERAAAAIADGTAAGGMAAKLEAALAALARGVERVRIGDLDAARDPARGTLIAHARSFA